MFNVIDASMWLLYILARVVLALLRVVRLLLSVVAVVVACAVGVYLAICYSAAYILILMMDACVSVIVLLLAVTFPSAVDIVRDMDEVQ